MKLETLSLRLFVLLAFALAFALPTHAQEEGEPVVIDQVLAQVNNDVVTLSQVKREMNQAAEALAQNRLRQLEAQLSKQGRTAAEIEAEINRQQTDVLAKARTEVEPKMAEFIANLINETLVIQQSKELGMESEVEAEVNKRLLEIGKEYNLKTIPEIESFMSARGVSPADFRASARKGIAVNYVFGQEVDRKTYEGLTPAEVKSFYDKDPARFAKPTTYTLSEIFLGIAGKDAATVEARAKELVRQARTGGDFAALAATISERPDAATTKGKIGAVSEKDLNAVVLPYIQKLRAGQVSEPVKTPDGFIILRVDERTDPAANAYNENEAREALTITKLPKARAEYVKELREAAFVKVNSGYRAAVEVELNKAAASDAASNTQPATSSK